MEDAIDGARQARADRDHPARQRGAVYGLDDEVDVVRLQGILRDPEVATLARLRDAALECADEPRGAERRDVGTDAQRDVRGVASGDGGAGRVGQPGSLARRLPAGAVATSTPSAGRGQLKLELSVHSHVRKL